MCFLLSREGKFLRVDTACACPASPEMANGSAAGSAARLPQTGKAGAYAGHKQPAERLDLGLQFALELQVGDQWVSARGFDSQWTAPVNALTRKHRLPV